MGGVILIFLLVLLVTILVLPAMRARKGQRPLGQPDPDPAHEVVVHQLDDHRGKKNTPSDDAQKPQG